GRLSGAGRPGHDDQLSRTDLDAIVEQYLISRLSFAVIVVDAVDAHDRVGFDLDQVSGHQNNAAGSAAMTRRTAIRAAPTHIVNVRARLIAVSPIDICIGSRTLSPMSQNNR